MMLLNVLNTYDRHLHIILYANDILLLAPTVTELEKLLKICEAGFLVYFYFL